MIFGRKRKLKVDIGELDGKIESLSNFLNSKLKVELSLSRNAILIYSPSLSPSYLKNLVNKFVYRHHLNHTYWVGLEVDTVKIHKFKNSKKKDKQKNPVIPSTIKHGW